MLTPAQTISDPPLLEHLLLENPWPIFITLIAIAAVVRVVASRQGRPKLNRIALVAVMLALIAFLTAHFVQTPRERVSAAVHELLDAIVAGDTAALDRLIGHDATVGDEAGRARIDAERLRPDLQRVLERFPIASQRVKDLAVQPDGSTATAYLDLRTGFTDNRYPPAHTIWRLTWRRGDDGAWRLTEARWLEWMGRSPPWTGWR